MCEFAFANIELSRLIRSSAVDHKVLVVTYGFNKESQESFEDVLVPCAEVADAVVGSGICTFINNLVINKYLFIYIL